jgi:PAS domain S-box-containing protein
MKPGQGLKPPKAPRRRQKEAMLPEEIFTASLADFPDPVLLAQGKKVVFLNHAARKLFGSALSLGDPCPICRLAAKEAGKEGNRAEFCPGEGTILNNVPIFWIEQGPGEDPLNLAATAGPIRKDGGRPTGCFVALRELHLDLLANRTLQLQRATLTSVLDNFPMPFFMVNPDLMITHVNDQMEKLTGYSRSEMVGKMTCGEVLNTVQCGTCDCVLQQVMTARKPVDGVRRAVRDRQGREIQVTVSASIIVDQHDKVIGGFEAIQDITPIVEAQRKIDLLAELTHEGILMVDENQKILFANSKMANIVEKTREELIGKDLGEVLTAQHRRSALELTRLVEKGYQWDLQFCNTMDPLESSSTGERRVFETCMAASSIGNSTLICIYLRDLSYRVKIGRELYKTNTFLQNIIQCSVDGIVVVDPKGIPIIFNEGAERILGFRAEEIIGNRENLFKFYPPELAFEVMRRIRSNDYGPPDRLGNMQVVFINKEGEEVPVNFSAAIIREGDKEIASVGIFSDLRETMKMRRELEKSQAQLLQAEKIAGLGRLAAGVAHEINNPLAGILIYAEILKRDLEENTEARNNMEIIIEQTVRCQQIVNRLLEFSRQSLGQKVLFDLNEIISRCVDLISHQPLFHNIEINRDLDPKLPQIIGDPGQLQQVITNLMLNAADAMHGHGKISISSRPGPGGEGVVLTFTDTGPGISPAIKGKIFEPFFTTKPPGKGTGLGLSIVYGVLQRHGGTIEVGSSPQGGAVFILTLPLDSPEYQEIPFEIPARR